VRGQGVGSALLDAAERWLPEARHMFLCVSSFNTRARQLYERCGYTKVGEFPDYVIAGSSEILMHKRLVRRP
jgi:ribosomal protein S18 acetylase RimI-like enzyme